jgi:hypothetical protein
MRHWGCPHWVVAVESALSDCCRGGSGRLGDVDHRVDRLVGRYTGCHCQMVRSGQPTGMLIHVV